MFLIPDFWTEKITEGETPPAPIIKTFFQKIISEHEMFVISELGVSRH